MNNLTALKELLVKVEAGNAPFAYFTAVFKFGLAELAEKTFICNDETAAFALTREVLGDRWAMSYQEIGRPNGDMDFMFSLHQGFRSDTYGGNYQTVEKGYDFDGELPTAILLAVIKALIFEKENG